MTNSRETALMLDPKFDGDGLLTAVVTDSVDGTLLMVGHMNAESLAKSQEFGTVIFFSRSRQQLWQKGETSGHFLRIVEMRVDCDQDAIWVIAKPEGPTCHTGARSCFYRRIVNGKLESI